MSSFLSGFAVLALFACAVVAVDLDGCRRGRLIVEKAKQVPSLRKDIKKDLGFSLGGNGTIAGFSVQDKDRSETMFVAFAGRNKGRSAVTFAYDVDFKSDKAGPMRAIPFDDFFKYLECEPLFPNAESDE